MFTQEVDVDHGKMQWTGEFDLESYAIFRCAQCSREVGLKPGHIKDIDLGELSARHHAWILPKTFDAALVEDLWGIKVDPDLVLVEMKMIGKVVSDPSDMGGDDDRHAVFGTQ